ncbi:hypothetical protein BX666DRAFT_2032592 [Dichotomocladium elegans]|nr:hypothetical protein BX666DRAFT_2032592 [Dichotomocladium elegans]
MLQQQDTDRIILAPPSPPCSSIAHEDEKLHISSSSLKSIGPSVIETLSHCNDDIHKAQRCLKDQYKRGVLLRSYTEPSSGASSNLMDCHRLAVEALQHLYVQERHRHIASIQQVNQANEQIAKLQQELALQKRQHDAAQRKIQQEMDRVYELADTLLDISSVAAPTPAARSHRRHTAGSPAELHSRLRDILGNLILLQQRPALMFDSPHYYERDHYPPASFQVPY